MGKEREKEKEKDDDDAVECCNVWVRENVVAAVAGTGTKQYSML